MVPIIASENIRLFFPPEREENRAAQRGSESRGVRLSQWEGNEQTTRRLREVPWKSSAGEMAQPHMFHV